MSMSTTQDSDTRFSRIYHYLQRAEALLVRWLFCSMTVLGAPMLAADQRVITSPSSTGEVSVKIGQRVVRSMYQRCGDDVHFLEVPAARAFMMAEAGQSDGELARAKEAVKPGAPLRSLTEILLELPLVPVYSANYRSPPTGASGERWGVLQGYRRFAGMLPSEITAVPVRGTKQLYDLLDRHRIDAALMMAFDARVYSRIDKGLEVGEPVGHVTLYHFVHETRAASVPCLSQQLSAMKRDGEYYRIIEDTVDEYVAKNRVEQPDDGKAD
ncbi:MAG: hypothetical protein CL581_06210 [Alteromonadaceae bacterium]|nr:hypothetical protein [Alteromonadaceae bacterium]MBH84382.1 hypothetical protein [Alteromonadaceae bacterium]